VYVNKKLAWMVPYVERGLLLIPDGKSVTRLGAWTRGGRYGKQETAALITNNNRHYRIYIHTHAYTHPRGVTPHSKIEMLELLAHEMAHMIDDHFDEHTPEHRRLEAKLTSLFMTMLKKSGYHSEERELR
jgi:hypothetical protein